MKEKRINKRIQTGINEVRSLLSGIWSDEMMKQKTSLWRGIYLTQLMSNSVYIIPCCKKCLRINNLRGKLIPFWLISFFVFAFWLQKRFLVKNWQLMFFLAQSQHGVFLGLPRSMHYSLEPCDPKRMGRAE